MADKNTTKKRLVRTYLDIVYLLEEKEVDTHTIVNSVAAKWHRAGIVEFTKRYSRSVYVIRKGKGWQEREPELRTVIRVINPDALIAIKETIEAAHPNIHDMVEQYWDKLKAWEV